MTARTRSAKLYYDMMPEAGAVPERREVSESDRACKPTEESEKECSPGSPKAPESWTTVGHSHEYDGHALDDLAISASSSNVHSSSNTELFRIEPEMATSLHDMSNEDLCSFAELHEDLVNDVQIELYIFTYFLLFTRTLSREYLEQAIQRTKGWVAVTDLDDPDRVRRFQIFDMMSARKYISKSLPLPMGER